jgi:hypothetical protein
MLIDREEIKSKLSAAFQPKEFPVTLVADLIHQFPAPAESVFYRMAQVLPRFFNIDQIYLLRTEKNVTDHQFEIVRELHLTSLHSPHSVHSGEAYCKRWITSKLINGTKLPALDVQRSYFPDSGQEYINLGYAYRQKDNKNVCLTLGISNTASLRQTVKWAESVSKKEVGSTCERCQIQNCSERAAEFNQMLGSNRFEKIEALIESLPLHSTNP